MEGLGEAARAVHAFLAPPPLSPLFQDGGLLHGLNEDVALIGLGIALLAAIDWLVVRPFVHPKARYFALHTVANTISVLGSFPDVRRALWADPLRCFTGPSHTMVANSICAAIHLYHVLAFSLRRDEVAHHVIFASVLCGLAIPFKHMGGVANNFGCFFLSGLPGGISYLLLVLVKHGVVSKMGEKLWSARINTWLRGPSMAVYAYLAWQAWVLGSFFDGSSVGAFLLFLVAALHFVNGQHYAAEAVAGHAKWQARLDLQHAANAANGAKDKAA